MSIRAQFSATEYLAAVDHELLNVQQASRNYAKATMQSGSQKTEKKRHILLGAVTIAISNLSALPPFGYDTSLRDSALIYLALQQAVLTEDFGKIVDLGPIADKAFDPMEAYLSARAQSEEVLRKAASAVEKQYQVFAQKHGLKAERSENQLARDLSSAASVHSYFQEVYNLFFECYKQESYLLSAIANNDVSGMEQNRQALGDMAKKGIQTLKKLGDYRGDGRLSDACTRLLSFYRKEAQTDLANTATFFVEKENLARMQEARVLNRDTTNKEGEKKYLKALKRFNHEAGEFNTTYFRLEQKRKDLLVSWNAASEAFFRRHLP